MVTKPAVSIFINFIFQKFSSKRSFFVNLDLNTWCWCVTALVLMVEVDEESFETARNSTTMACWSRLQSRLMTKIFELDLQISTSHTWIHLEYFWNALSFNSFDIPWFLFRFDFWNQIAPILDNISNCDFVLV